MQIEGWRYYNHAMIATGAPGEEANLEPLKNGDIWKGGKHVLFARWISDYDCDRPTQWWYCLKDNAYDITGLNSKKRYRITRGRKYFDVRVINENEMVQKLIDVEIKAFSEYPEEYRPNLNHDHLQKQIMNWDKNKHKVFGAFKSGTDELCGYSLINEFEKYCYFVQQKVDPDCEKNEINAALVDGILQYYDHRIQNGYPIVDGQRNLVHETAFQDYLCRIFGFRMAYCRLNVVYKRWVNAIVKILYPHKEFFKNKKGKLFHSLYSVLQMEEICRSFE